MLAFVSTVIVLKLGVGTNKVVNSAIEVFWVLFCLSWVGDSGRSPKTIRTPRTGLLVELRIGSR